MAPMTGGQVLARSLVQEGVDTLFALPGVQLDWAFDGLYDLRDAITVYHTRHEQATAYMADGYARTTGRVGVCMVVPGPGVLNAGAALATAYATSSPVFCLAGQVDSRGIDQDLGLLHEVPQQLSILRSVTKWARRARKPNAIPKYIQEGFQQLRSGRIRPVALEIPPDVLQACADRVQLRQPLPGLTNAGDPDLLQQAAELLQQAERPVFYCGGGVLAAAAWEEVQAIAEQLEMPVVMSLSGRGVLSDRSYLAHTGLSGQALCEEADLILAVGTRFWQPAQAWKLAAGAKVIRIDADEAEVTRTSVPTVGIVADAKHALSALRDLVTGGKPRRSRKAELTQRKATAEAKLTVLQPLADYNAALRAAMPDDAILVNDLTQLSFYGTIGFPVYCPRTYIGPGYQGTLGSAFATALGAQVGNPDKKVVALAGDGGFLYTIQELATQRQHGINVVSVVFNDNAFGNVKRIQQQQFTGRLIGSDLVNPDFVALAQSFGIRATCVQSPAALGDALRSALAANEPGLIEVQVGEMPSAWPLIVPAGGAYPYLLP